MIDLEYPLIISNNHYLAQIDGRNFVIDTGSPLSFGSSRSLSFAGETKNLLPMRALGSRESMVNLVKTQVDGLIGTDFMMEHEITLDKKSMKIIVDEHRIIPAGSIGMGMLDAVLIKGFPNMWIELNGKHVKAVLDTGACISYASKSLVDGLPIVGTATDYNPNLGSFSTNLYEVCYSIKGLTGSISIGTLSSIYHFALERFGFYAVLGMDIFSSFEAVSMDFVRRRIEYGAAL